MTKHITSTRITIMLIYIYMPAAASHTAVSSPYFGMWRNHCIECSCLNQCLGICKYEEGSSTGLVMINEVVVPHYITRGKWKVVVLVARLVGGWDNDLGSKPHSNVNKSQMKWCYQSQLLPFIITYPFSEAESDMCWTIESPVFLL